MNIRHAIGAAALAVASVVSVPAAASCTASFALGSMGPPAAAALFNQFDTAQTFDDCYNFTLNNSADAFGLSLEWDWSYARNIDVTSVSLSGGNLSGTVTDGSAEGFSFSNLLAGTYQLIVSGIVTAGDLARYDGGSVGYVGVLATNRSSVAAPVPEPETYAMLALGLAVVGWAARRGKRKA
jgi:hypothetical protein